MADKPITKIDVVIPYHPGNLGQSYNVTMKRAEGWVLFLDHDILMLRPEWYQMCLDAINQVGEKAGWISGVTNRIVCPDQHRPLVVDNDDIEKHAEFSNTLFDAHGSELIKPTTDVPFSGFFILTHKKAWQDAGGFCDGFLGVDNDYYKKLIDKGYETYIMPGLYMYHIYKKKQRLFVDRPKDIKLSGWRNMKRLIKTILSAIQTEMQWYQRKKTPTSLQKHRRN